MIDRNEQEAQSLLPPFVFAGTKNGEYVFDFVTDYAKAIENFEPQDIVDRAIVAWDYHGTKFTFWMEGDKEIKQQFDFDAGEPYVNIEKHNDIETARTVLVAGIIEIFTRRKFKKLQFQPDKLQDYDYEELLRIARLFDVFKGGNPFA